MWEIWKSRENWIVILQIVVIKRDKASGERTTRPIRSSIHKWSPILSFSLSLALAICEREEKQKWKRACAPDRAAEVEVYTEVQEDKGSKREDSQRADSTCAQGVLLTAGAGIYPASEKVSPPME